MLKIIKKDPYSLFVAVFCSLFIIYFRFHDPITNVLSWDPFGYYLYLPATFIYHDLGIKDPSWVNHIMDQYHASTTFYQAFLSPTNHMVIKYTIGSALFYSPFFFIAHWLAPLLGYPADGFSMPYQFCQVIGALIWCIIGIFMLRKLLLHYVADKIVAMALLALLLGTNFLGTAAKSTLMPHILLFTVYTLILWFTVKWHEDGRPRYLIILGLLIGLVILVRPPDAIAILIPLLWGIHDRSSLLEKVKKIFRQALPVVLFLLLIFVVCLPQMLYWKSYGGKFLYYSYVNPGEGFDFFPPYTIKFLFNFRKGWFIYTPVMLIAMYGFYLLYREKRPVFWALTVFFLLNLYIVSSWSCWWYAASFGQRAMVQSYPVMAIPLVLVIGHWSKLTSPVKYFWFLILSFLILLNLFQHWQYTFKKVISPDRMTAAYYFRTFGKSTVSAEDIKLLLVDRYMATEEFRKNLSQYNRSVLGTINFEMPFEKSTNYHPEDTLVHWGDFALCLDSNCIYTPAIKVRYMDITTKEYAWIKVSAWIYPLFDPKDNPTNVVIHYTHNGGVYYYHAQTLNNLSPEIAPGKWNKIEMYVMTPEVRNTEDVLVVYLWHVGKKPVLVDDLMVEAFEPKD
jgi:hypothetical protein